MTNDLINLIEDELVIAQQELVEAKERLRIIRPTFIKIKKHYNGSNGAHCINLIDEQELEKVQQNIFFEIGDPVEVMAKNVREKQMKIIELQKEFYKLGFNPAILDNPCSLFVLSNQSERNPSYEKANKIVVKILDENKALKLLRTTISNINCECIIDNLNELEKEKEELKEKIRILKSANSNLSNNIRLTPTMVGELTMLINQKKYDENQKELLIEFLNGLIRKNTIVHLTKEQTFIKEDPIIIQEESPMPVVYVDDQKNNYVNNYLSTIRALSDFSSIKKFLDKLNFSINVEVLIMKIFELLSNSDDDKLLKGSLEIYLEGLKKDDKIQGNNNENILLYYNFSSENNVVLKDVKKGIDSYYYGDILKAIDNLKTYGISKKCSQYVDFKNVWKIRVDDIRLTFTRISSNVYIILGIFCKKNKKGTELIKTLKHRLKSFEKDKKMFINTLKIPEYYQTLIESSNEVEQEVYSLLNKKTK